MSQILLLISSCFCFKSRQDLNLISPISRSDFYHKAYYLFMCAQITLCSPNRNKPNLCHMLSSQISCKVLVKLALRNFIHHGEAILRFLFLPNDTNNTQNIQFDLRDREKTVISIQRHLLRAMHWRARCVTIISIQPEVCSLLLRTMCLSISLGRCFCSVGTISVSGQQTPSRVHHNKASIMQMRSHCI